MDCENPVTTESENSSNSSFDSESTVDNRQFVDSLLEPSLPVISHVSGPHEPLSSPRVNQFDMSTDVTSKSSSSFNLNIYSTVPKLKTGTFNNWKLRLTTILGAQRLEKFISSEVVPPTNPDDLADHMANSMATLTALHITVDDENFQIICGCSSPRDAYEKLCRQHDDAGGLSTANLFTDLVSLRLTSDGSLTNHLHAFRSLHNDLLSNLSSTPSITISEPFIAILLIISLPSQYTPLAQTLLVNFESISLSRLYSLLKIDSMRTSTSSKADTALHASKPTSKPEKKKDGPAHQGSSNGLICSLGHPGHSDEGCRTQRWSDFMEYEKKMKGKVLNVKESAQLTNSAQEQADISYYDEAFSAFSSRVTKVPDIFDTGATTHMFSDKSRFNNLTSISPSCIGVASKEGSIWATQKGSVNFHGLTLRNVLHSPELTANLISIGLLCDSGIVAVFRAQDGLLINSDKQVILRLTRDPNSDRLWHPMVSFIHSSAMTITMSKADIASLWHQRLGHLHPDGVILFLKHKDGTRLQRKDFGSCDACSMGKLVTTPATHPFHRAPQVLELIHSDLIGPIYPPTISGLKYILTFIDNHTRYNTVYLIQSKDQTVSKFLEYKATIEKRTGRKIGKLKTDRGGEYSSNEFIQLLKNEGILTERGPAHRPQANSVAERFNRTLLGRLRTQLIQSGLPLALWGELAKYSSIQINCSPHKAINQASPQAFLESLSTGHIHPFDTSRLKPFGSLCFAVNRHRKSKVAPIGQRFIFVGLEKNARAARLWNKNMSRIFFTGDVVYREQNFPALNKTRSPALSNTTLLPADMIIENCSSSSGNNTLSPSTGTHSASNNVLSLPSDSSHTQSPDSLHIMDNHVPEAFDESNEASNGISPSITENNLSSAPTSVPPLDMSVPDTTRRSSRVSKSPDRCGFSATTRQDPNHPTFTQAMAGPDKAAWIKAMGEEFDSLLHHEVGTLVDPPPNSNILGGMWVFNRKRDEFNRITRYKAQWVVFGNHQIKGLDYNDTYASVGKVDSLRILLALAVAKKLHVVQFDVVTAFLNGDMKDVVYCRQVLGFIHPSLKKRVWKLNKSLYGTKQAARRWQQHFGNTVLNFHL